MEEMESINHSLGIYVPTFMIRDVGMIPANVYSLMCSLSDANGICTESQDSMASYFAMDRKTINRAIGILKKKNYVVDTTPKFIKRRHSYLLRFRL